MHEPYFVLKQWSFVNDEYILKYYPEGGYQEPEVVDKVKWEDIAERFLRYEKDVLCHISMSSSIEWLYVFYRFGKGSMYYTEEQLEDMTERWTKKYPQLLSLHYAEDGQMVVDMLLNFPQESQIDLKTFKEIMKGNK